MIDGNNTEAAKRWFPLIRSEEVMKRRVAQVQLLGKELVIWRADDGRVNVWENRCPHRGVRLSLGTNKGDQLKCRYHGFCYSSESGQCVSIPSDLKRSISKNIKTKVFPCFEKYGYVWTGLASKEDPPKISLLENTAFTTLRSLFTNAPLETVVTSLSAYRFIPNLTSNSQETIASAQIHALDAYTFEAKIKESQVLLMLQPISEKSTMLHAILLEELKGKERLAALRHHNERLIAVRDIAESSYNLLVGGVQ